jgi:integrase
MRGIDRPRVKQRAVLVLDRDEARRTFEAARNHHYGIIIQVAMLTGMRRSELLGLRWPNVTFHENDSGTIRVVESAQWVAGHGWVFAATKTDRSRRSIAISKVVVKLLREWRGRQRATVMGSIPDRVFTSRNGTPVTPSTLRRTWARVQGEAGLSPRGFHTLRHTHASLLLASGANPKVISERLGHASVAFTLQVYSHLLPTMQEGAAQALEDLIAGSMWALGQIPAAAIEDAAGALSFLEDPSEAADDD